MGRLLYLCSEVTLSSKDGEYLRRQYRTTQALYLTSNMGFQSYQ